MNVFLTLQNYPSLFIFLLFTAIIIFAIIITVLFEQSSSIRNNVLFNNGFAILAAIFFAYIIFKFMDQKITIFQYSIDIGLILFLTIGIFIIFIIGD